MHMHKLRDLCGLFNGNPIWSSVGLPIRIPDGSHITALVEKKMKGITGACLEFYVMRYPDYYLTFHTKIIIRGCLPFITYVYHL